MAAHLIAIGEPIDEQKIEHLVLPSSRRRSELSSKQLGEIEVQQTFFDLLGHVSCVSLNSVNCVVQFYEQHGLLFDQYSLELTVNQFICCRRQLKSGPLRYTHCG